MIHFSHNSFFTSPFHCPGSQEYWINLHFQEVTIFSFTKYHVKFLLGSFFKVLLPLFSCGTSCLWWWHNCQKKKRNYLEMWGNYLQECNGDTCFVWLQNAIPQTPYSPKNTLFTGLIFLIYTVSQHEQGRHSRGTFVGLSPQVTLRSDWFLLWQ